jgi:hypothetical protein
LLLGCAPLMRLDAHKTFQPGVGPYGEGEALRLAVQQMRTQSPKLFSEARTKRLPDVLIPGQWALEFKFHGTLLAYFGHGID